MLPLTLSGCLELQAGAGGHHRRAPGVDGGDDLFGVDALQVDRGGAEIRVAELALDDVERHALARKLDGVGVAQLVRRKARRTPAAVTVRRSSARAAALDQCRPRVAPLRMHKSGPIGSPRRNSGQG